MFQYSIMNPTGNITALVEDRVEIARQPAVASVIMERHPDVEQVGFVTFNPPPEAGCPDGDRPVDVKLRMAGGEFCGNAALSAAALYLLRSSELTADSRVPESPVSGQNGKCGKDTFESSEDGIFRVSVLVSGSSQPVEARLKKEDPGRFYAGIHMPPVFRLEKRMLAFEGTEGSLPLVCMEGISHIIIEPESAFFTLLQNHRQADRAIRKWCQELDADGLGLMFLREGRDIPDKNHYLLTPLVYIPGSHTVFWENSCASGTSALGYYLAAREGKTVDILVGQPGGDLRVVSDPAGQETWLYGRTGLTKRQTI